MRDKMEHRWVTADEYSLDQLSLAKSVQLLSRAQIKLLSTAKLCVCNKSCYSELLI